MNTKQIAPYQLNERTRQMIYEIEKRELQQKGLSPIEYEQAIRALCAKYRI